MNTNLFSLDRIDDGPLFRWTPSPILLTPAGTLQGGAGLGAAISAMQIVSGRPVIWATAQYLAFALGNAPVELEVTIEVSGHNTTQARCVVSRDGKEILTAHSALGSRDFDVEDVWCAPPAVPAPEDCPEYRFVANREPNQTQVDDGSQSGLPVGFEPIGGTRSEAEMGPGRFTQGSQSGLPVGFEPIGGTRSEAEMGPGRFTQGSQSGLPVGFEPLAGLEAKRRWGPSALKGSDGRFVEFRLAKGRQMDDIAEQGGRGTGSFAVWVKRTDGAMIENIGDLTYIGDFLPIGFAEAMGQPYVGNSLDNTVRVGKLVSTPWVLLSINIQQVSRGFGYGRAELWAQDGTLLAETSQSAILRLHTKVHEPRTGRKHA